MSLLVELCHDVKTFCSRHGLGSIQNFYLFFIVRNKCEIQSEAADTVGCLFANPTHLRHCEGHRPLPKYQLARDDLLGMIRSFIVENSCE